MAKAQNNTSWDVTFSADQMRIAYTDVPGVTKVELFDLHQTRPEGVWSGTSHVVTHDSRMFILGMLTTGDSPQFVAWPV